MRSVISLALILAPAASAQLVSTFDASRESWTVQTRSDPRGAFTVIANFTPDFISSGGDGGGGGGGGGYIQEVDPDSNWSFFVAPPSWAGDRSPLYGRPLEYSTRTSVQNYPDGRLVVLIAASGQKISHATPLPPINTWVRRSIPLQAGSWYVGSSGGGALATQAQVRAVLADLSLVLIGLEFGGELAEEMVGLDRVRFGACAADFNVDGFLDFFDYDDYVNCFETGVCGNESADFNDDGFVDFFDYDDFVAAFEAGC